MATLGSSLSGALSSGGGSTSVGSVIAYVQADTSNLNAGLMAGERRVATFARRISAKLRTAGTAFKMVGMQATLVGAAVTGSLVAMTKGYMDFDDAMRHATSISNVTQAQFETMSDMAERAAVRLNTSASTVAGAFYYLAEAGLTATEQMGAFDTVVNFARVSSMDAAEATEIMVNIVRGMNLSFEEVARVADLITAAVISSNQNLKQLGHSMSMVASIAYETHTPLNQVAASFGLMANAGIKGTRAGTAMRRAMVNFMAPSREMTSVLQAYNIKIRDGNKVMRPWVDIVMEMSSKLKDADEQQRDYAFATLMGVRALTGQLAVFRDHGKIVQAYSKTLENAAGTLDRVLKKQMASLKNVTGSTMKELGILSRHAIVTLEPAMRGVAAALTPVVQKLTEWVRVNPELTASIMINTAKIGLAALAVGALSFGLGSLLQSLSYLIPAAVAVGKVLILPFTALIGPVGVAIAAIAAIGFAVYSLRASFIANFMGIADMLKSWADWFKKVWATIVPYLMPIYQWMVDNFGTTLKAMGKQLRIFINGAMGLFKGYWDYLKVGWETGSYKKAWQALNNGMSEAIDDDWLSKAFEGMDKTVLAGLRDSESGVAAWTSAIPAYFSDMWETIAAQFAADSTKLAALVKEKAPGFTAFLKMLEDIKNFKLPTLITPIEPDKDKKLGGSTESGSVSKPSPWWFTGMQRYSDDIHEKWPTLTAFMADTMVDTMDSIQGSMSEAFEGMMMNAKSMKEAMVGFANEIKRAFVKMLTDVIAQQLMLAATKSIVSFFPSFGSFGAAPAAVAAPVGHNGIPAFYSPPRLHKGLAPDEFPAILQKGEEVVPKGGMSQQLPTIVNEIKVINQTSTPVSATSSTSQFDMERMVTTIVLKDSRQYGPLKSAGVIK